MLPIKRPSTLYALQVREGTLKLDPHQVQHLSIMDALAEAAVRPKPWWGRVPADPVAGRGAYLHGPVGRGKSVLMALLSQSLGDQVCRLHMHAFMQEVHERLKQHQGQRNPLKAVVAPWARQYRMLALDEFLVNDIGDAMILKGLLEALLAEGLWLCITSNTAPQDLYLHGLQRERFVPAIQLMQQHLTVLSFEGPVDHRTQFLCRQPHYWVGPGHEAALQTWFVFFQEGHAVDHSPFWVAGRSIPCVRRAGPVAWWTFADLCQAPRSVSDYLQLAQHHAYWVLEGVPAMADQGAAAARFMHLIDVLYEAHAQVLIQADVPLKLLFEGSSLPWERTRSRLEAMQSTTYASTHQKGGQSPGLASHLPQTRR